MFAELKRDLSK
jgi:hypothetical protein